MKGRTIKGYVMAIDIVAVVAFAVLFRQHVTDYWVGTFLLATLVAIAGASPVRIPALKVKVSATDPFVFTALAAFGPMPACLVAAAGVLGAALRKDNHRQVLHLAFNLGNVVVAASMASVAYLLVGGVPGAPVAQQIWPLVVATTANFLVNTVLVSGAIALDTGRGFLSTWRESGLWTGVSAYAGLTLSAGLLYALQTVGPSGLALGIPPCWLLAAFYRTHKERQEEQQRRIDQVEEMNQKLEDKVAERTQELRKAFSHLEEANEQLLSANRQLVEANRAKSEFLANVSHELRTPLNAIIGFSDLLREPSFGELSDEQSEFIQDIHSSGEHLLRLINDILDLSKIEAGKMEVHNEIFDVPRRVQEAVAMLRPQAVAKQLSLTADCTPGVGSCELDPGMFQQVLVNLLSNAVKFTPEGGSVGVVASRRGDDLIVSVEDTGIGIDPDHIDDVFDEFYQVDGSYSRSYGGTGLGLALVRTMVQMQGGRIGVESTVGVGTRFTCVYPDTLREVPARVDERPSPSPTEHASRKAGSGEQRILVVEDNPVNLKLARNVLRSRGYSVVEADSGEAALDYLRREAVDLILMDIQLPGMDGLEVTRRIKQTPATADLPIIALTAHAGEADQQRALDAGCDGYITKPIRLAQFPSQVEAFLLAAAQVA
jgi:signal transduction histidine kinase/ActR/RegA family two-component response regulator